MYEQGLEDALSHSDEFKARHARFMKLVRPRSVWFEVFVRYMAITTVLSLVFAWGAPMVIVAVHDKGDLIDHLLREERLDPSEVCMVGDRKHDVLAAARHGIPTVGVLWGYGSREELETAGAALLVETPAGLLPPPAA